MEQALALHFMLLQAAPVPQSALALHVAGGVHFAPTQRTPDGQLLSAWQLWLPQVALLHRWPTPHDESAPQLCAAHVPPLQSRLTVHPAAVSQALFVHVALLHRWPTMHVPFDPQLAIEHVAPVHTPLLPQAESDPQEPAMHLPL